jgi:hypothetical protein
MVRHQSALRKIQSALNFEGCLNPAFRDTRGVGRNGVAGFVLGALFGVHLVVVLLGFLWPTRLWLVSPPVMKARRSSMASCAYVCCTRAAGSTKMRT